jgi:hypothetical protein
VKHGVHIVAVAAAASACVSVRPVASPEQFIPAQQPEVVWVTTHQEETIPIAGPTVRNAAISGIWQGVGDSVAVPLSQTMAVQARQPDRKRTTLLVVGVGVAAGFLVWRMVADNGSSGEVCYGGAYGNPSCYPP